MILALILAVMLPLDPWCVRKMPLLPVWIVPVTSITPFDVTLMLPAACWVTSMPRTKPKLLAPDAKMWLPETMTTSPAVPALLTYMPRFVDPAKVSTRSIEWPPEVLMLMPPVVLLNAPMPNTELPTAVIEPPVAFTVMAPVPATLLTSSSPEVLAPVAGDVAAAGITDGAAIAGQDRDRTPRRLRYRAAIGERNAAACLGGVELQARTADGNAGVHLPHQVRIERLNSVAGGRRAGGIGGIRRDGVGRAGNGDRRRSHAGGVARRQRR